MSPHGCLVRGGEVLEHPSIRLNRGGHPSVRGQVADLVTSVAPVRVLITSRAPLRVRGEREYVVEPLLLHFDAGALPPTDLARVPAVRFFLERVRDVRPDFRLTSAEGPTVAAICRRLDALLLALELAAPWLKALTPADL
jgi:predicted ATPase